MRFDCKGCGHTSFVKVACSAKRCASPCPEPRRKTVTHMEYLWVCRLCHRESRQDEQDLREDEFTEFRDWIDTREDLSDAEKAAKINIAAFRSEREAHEFDERVGVMDREVVRVLAWAVDYSQTVCRAIFAKTRMDREKYKKESLAKLATKRWWDVLVRSNSNVNCPRVLWEIQKNRLPKCISECYIHQSGRPLEAMANEGGSVDQFTAPSFATTTCRGGRNRLGYEHRHKQLPPVPLFHEAQAQKKEQTGTIEAATSATENDTSHSASDGDIDTSDEEYEPQEGMDDDHKQQHVTPYESSSDIAMEEASEQDTEEDTKQDPKGNAEEDLERDTDEDSVDKELQDEDILAVAEDPSSDKDDPRASLRSFTSLTPKRSNAVNGWLFSPPPSP